MRPKQISFVVLIVAAAAVCIRLGIWQLDRLQQVRAENRAIQQRMDGPPVDILDLHGDVKDLIYQPVTVHGTLDADHEVILSPRTYEDEPGADLVTPLRISGSSEAILINRGWIPYAETSPAARSIYRHSGVVEVTGIVRASGQLPSFLFFTTGPTPSPSHPRDIWQAVDIPVIQAQTPYHLLPYYVLQTKPLASGGDQPLPDSNIELSEGSHFSYAIQWFAFALIALVGGGAWFRRRSSDAPSPHPEKPSTG